MSWVEVYSDSLPARRGFGSYGIAKYPIRKQFTLVHYGLAITPVAYFRNEKDAMTFAAAFGLVVSDHRRVVTQ